MEQKMNVIKLHNNCVSSRKLSAEFKCSKTQIGNIIRQKDTILAKWTEGIDPKVKYVNPRHMVYTDLDKKCFEWFCSARDLGYVFTGLLILEQANIFALEMGLDDFSGSTGWLDAFKKQHQIKFPNLCGESADVPTSVVKNYCQSLPDICQGYHPLDIFNVDDSGLFYHQLQTKSLVWHDDNWHGGKEQKYKECFTIIFGCSALGEKLKLTVIGISAKPTSFRGKEGLCPVRYHHNNRAWTTGAEFDAYLSWLNNKCIAQDWKILLFIDNASGHVNLEYSNIKFSFLPANTTSHLQPLDAGIIAQTKAL